jgi:hypothetical protein
MLKDIMKKKINSVLIFIIIVFLTSIPVLNGYLYRGHDIYFHLMRIEGLADGIRNFQFPVKIQPTWYGGFGYSVSVFYGDLFLYIAAFIRLMGVSLQNSYKIYLVIINALTVFIAYYSFSGIFKNKHIGLFGAFLYNLSTYHLVNLYTRGAAGEYTAMAFLPLIAYATVLLLDREHKKENLKKGSVLLGVAMACILQSHILTSEIVCMILAGIMIIYIKRVLNKDVILAGLRAVGIALILSIGFLVPFIDYISQGIFNINNADNNIMIQSQGLFLSQIIALFDNAIGESLDWRTGAEGDFAQGVGIALALAIPCFIIAYILFRKHNFNRRTKEIGAMSLFISVVLMAMTSRHFPWDRLCKMSGVFRYIITNIQFPWRFTNFAVLTLVLLWCITIYMCLPVLKEKILILVAVAVILSSMSAAYYMNDLYNRGQRIEVYSAEDMGTYVASGEEYLPIGTDAESLKEENLTNIGVKISDYSKQGTTISFHCKATSDSNGIVELPLIYYKGYKAIGVDNAGNKVNLEITEGNNHVISLVIEKGSEYDITVSFGEPWYWRLAELVSLIAAIALIVKILIINKGFRKEI